MILENLSVIERQILANQFRILSKLNEEDEYASNSFEKKAEILEHGYTGEYSEVFEINIDEIPLQICNETNDILNMYRRINYSIAQLTEIEKSKLALGKIKFEGFDANNDPHYHYAKFMIEKLGTWEEYKDMHLNSHSVFPILKYRKMLVLQHELLENKFNLDKSDLSRFIEILSE